MSGPFSAYARLGDAYETTLENLYFLDSVNRSCGRTVRLAQPGRHGNLHADDRQAAAVSARLGIPRGMGDFICSSGIRCCQNLADASIRRTQSGTESVYCPAGD